MSRIWRNGSFPFYYWFLAGLAVGMLMGWFFSGFINMILRLFLLAAVIVAIGLVVYLWQGAGRPGEKSAKPSDIPEANWRTIDPAGRK